MKIETVKNHPIGNVLGSSLNILGVAAIMAGQIVRLICLSLVAKRHFWGKFNLVYANSWRIANGVGSVRLGVVIEAVLG